MIGATDHKPISRWQRLSVWFRHHRIWKKRETKLSEALSMLLAAPFLFSGFALVAVAIGIDAAIRAMVGKKIEERSDG